MDVLHEANFRDARAESAGAGKGGSQNETASVLGLCGSCLFCNAFLYWKETQVKEEIHMISSSLAKKIGLFAGGVLFGTAGVKILSSRDAKKAYVHCTAAALRAKDSVMKTATTVQENAEDILAEAKDINKKRNQQDDEAVYEDGTEAESEEQMDGQAE